MWDPDNLITLCRDCHIEQHPKWASRVATKRAWLAIDEQQKAMQRAAQNSPPARGPSLANFLSFALLVFCAGAFLLAIQQY